MVLEKLFGWGKKKEEEPDIQFGRYSDNNKSIQKVEKWNEAEDLFKQKEYIKSIYSFFDYLTDDDQQNVILDKKTDKTEFIIYQGSVVVRGEFDENKLKAEAALVRMPEPGTPVMRRLLEMNFHLYYTRYALKDEKVCMQFDTDTKTANPNKLYYGLKELATKSDKQDDLLLSDFTFLEPVETEHIIAVPEEEKETKFEFLQKWIRSTLDYIATLDAEKFSGGISYLLLTLVFRIDYLIAPQGKLLNDLEKIASTYYGKDDKSAPERNPAMIEGFNKLLNKTKEEIFSHLYRARYTFAIVAPHNLKSVNEAIDTALQNMVWYRDNGYPDIANKVMEYGFSYCQYSYSLPKPLSDLYLLFMRINYGEYFTALGFKTVYYDEGKNEFNEDEIKERIDAIINYWRSKYPSLSFRTKKLKFDTLLNFNYSFLQEVAQLNFE